MVTHYFPLVILDFFFFFLMMIRLQVGVAEGLGNALFWTEGQRRGVGGWWWAWRGRQQHAASGMKYCCCLKATRPGKGVSTGNQTTRKRSFKATKSLARMTTNNLNKVALIFPWVSCGHVVGQDNGEKRSLSDGERSHCVVGTLRGPSLCWRV